MVTQGTINPQHGNMHILKIEYVKFITPLWGFLVQSKFAFCKIRPTEKHPF